VGETLVIDRLGHRGDGIAALSGAPVFVPFALPGETVEAQIAGERGKLLRILQPSPQRIAPPCRHFGVCGGCQLQHLAPEAYLAFKRQLVIDAFADRGLAPDVGETVALQPGTRRRVTLHAERRGRVIVLGYNQRLSEEIVAIEEDPIAMPAIVAVLPALRALAAAAAPAKGRLDLTVTASLNGLDLAIAGGNRRMAERERARLTAEALDLGFGRVSLDGETLTREAPVVDFDGVRVTPPPGGFLQATVPSEQAMAAEVLAACAGASAVADLFSGCGTFALRLARHARVHAVEGDAASLAALDAARRTVPALKAVTAERRDLFHRPLIEEELGAYDAVVFDPPRAGAAAQAARLAASRVPTVVAVSCNPATLARDARALVDGGYRIERVTPIDQFLWSHHVEAVAVFRR
jgi:23S rRNA (uracil1939-C5)-methyltransferase